MKKQILFLIITIPFLLIGCEKETILTLDQTSISISDNGGSQYVSITANKPWTASSNQSWCKVSPSAGEEAAGSRITINCDQNTTYDARNATITFTCAELTKTVTVSQATNNGLLVSQTDYSISNEKQQLNIEVKANVKFSVEVDNGCKDWIKYNSTKALTTSTVVLDISENKSYDGRTGKVTIKQEGGNLSATVTIMQSQLDGLFVTTSEYGLSNERHTLTVEVKSNIDFEVKPEVGWIKYVETKGLKTNQITLDVAANETFDAREGRVMVKQKNGDLSGAITISQQQTNGLFITQTEYNLNNDEQTIDIEVKYNVDFDIVIPSNCKSWIKQVSTKGLNSQTYSFTIAKNEYFDAREGSITFKQKNGNLSGTVLVKQNQTDGLFLTTSEYNLSNEKHTLTVEVKSNIDFEVKSEADWIKYVETKGLKTNQIILDVSANESYDAREGKVIVKQKNGALSGTITVKQEQNYGLILSQTAFDLGNDSQTIDVEVKYNVDFDVVIPSGCKDWIKQVSTKGLNSRTHTFSIAKNETYDAREGSITFKQKNGALSGTVSVKQSQNNGLFVTKSDYEINNESQTVNVEVKANIDFDVKSESDWVKVVETKGLKTSTIVLSIEENDSYDAREGKVSVSQKDGDLKGTINIRQQGKNGIVLPQSEYELTNEAQTLNVEVQSTIPFEVVISDTGKEWVSLVSSKGLDTKICSFSIKKNETYDNRECTVTFKQKGGQISNAISIKQAQTDFLEVSPTDFTVGSNGGTIAVNVKSNIGYDIYIDDVTANWISYIEPKGVSDEVINFIISAYNGEEDRLGQIVISKNNFSFIVIVKQTALKPPLISSFSFGKDTYSLCYDSEGRLSSISNVVFSYDEDADSGGLIVTASNNWILYRMSMIDDMCIQLSGTQKYSNSDKDKMVIEKRNTYDTDRQLQYCTEIFKEYELGSENATSEYIYTTTYNWWRGNIESIVGKSKAKTYENRIEYYSQKNPWRRSGFDIVSWIIEEDGSSERFDSIFGFSGKHCENLPKAIYEDGLLWKTYTYYYDNQGRIIRIHGKENADYFRETMGSVPNRDLNFYYYIKY